MAWWLWYLAGLLTLPVAAGAYLGWDTLWAANYGWKCRCGWTFHWVYCDGRRIWRFFCWQWHKRFRCPQASRVLGRFPPVQARR